MLLLFCSSQFTAYLASEPPATRTNKDGGDATGGDHCGPTGPAEAPSPSSFKGANRPCNNRLACTKPCQVIGQLLCGGVASARIFLQAFHANRFQIARHRAI